MPTEKMMLSPRRVAMVHTLARSPPPKATASGYSRGRETKYRPGSVVIMGSH